MLSKRAYANGTCRVVFTSTIATPTAKPEEKPKAKSEPSVVRVFRLARFDRRQGPTHGQAVYVSTVSATRSEAETLVYYGFAAWRGRGHRQMVLRIPVNAYLNLLGEKRSKIECNPVALDNKTHTFSGPRTYRHARNANYGQAARDISNVPFLSEYPYCDLALEAYRAEV